MTSLFKATDIYISHLIFCQNWQNEALRDSQLGRIGVSFPHQQAHSDCHLLELAVIGCQSLRAWITSGEIWAKKGQIANALWVKAYPPDWTCSIFLLIRISLFTKCHYDRILGFFLR